MIRINSILEPRGVLVISVPTPNYPKYFSREFAERIGHVRNGYTIEELRRLLEASGFRIMKWSCHTNFIASQLCRLWYYYNMPYKLKLLAFPLLKTLCKVDFIGNGVNSYGIIIKAIKNASI